MTAEDVVAPLRLVMDLSDAQVSQLWALYQDEWWTKGRTLEGTRACIKGSQICIGILNQSDNLVAFARVLTDYTYKALIFDVIVAPAYRLRGLGDQLVSAILDHEELGRVRSFELYCLPELVPFYRRHGFGDDVGEIKLMRWMRAVSQPHEEGG